MTGFRSSGRRAGATRTRRRCRAPARYGGAKSWGVSHRDPLKDREGRFSTKAFPPDNRTEDLSFSHHRIAAMTEDPAQWLDTAVDHRLSVDELREAIRDAADPIAEADETERAEKRVARAVDRYIDQWSLITGRRAVLTPEGVGAGGAV